MVEIDLPKKVDATQNVMWVDAPKEVCRKNSDDKTLDGSGSIHLEHENSLEVCRKACVQTHDDFMQKKKTYDCYGIEYRSTTHRCEIWTVPARTIKAEPLYDDLPESEFTCDRYILALVDAGIMIDEDETVIKAEEHDEETVEALAMKKSAEEAVGAATEAKKFAAEATKKSAAAKQKVADHMMDVKLATCAEGANSPACEDATDGATRAAAEAKTAAAEAKTAAAEAEKKSALEAHQAAAEAKKAEAVAKMAAAEAKQAVAEAKKQAATLACASDPNSAECAQAKEIAQKAAAEAKTAEAAAGSAKTATEASAAEACANSAACKMAAAEAKTAAAEAKTAVTDATNAEAKVEFEAAEEEDGGPPLGAIAAVLLGLCLLCLLAMYCCRPKKEETYKPMANEDPEANAQRERMLAAYRELGELHIDLDFIKNEANLKDPAKGEKEIKHLKEILDIDQDDEISFRVTTNLVKPEARASKELTVKQLCESRNEAVEKLFLQHGIKKSRFRKLDPMYGAKHQSVLIEKVKR